MKRSLSAWCLASLLACAPASAQDVTKAAPEASRVLFENAYIRVVELTFAPGTQVGPYSHPAGWY